MTGVEVSPGVWKRLEDYCNSTPRGSQFQYTAGIVYAEEELFGIENGWRVLDVLLEKEIDGWDALLRLQAKEDLG